MTVKELIRSAPAFSEGTIRRWLFNRETNGLDWAVYKIGGRTFIDPDRLNIWLFGEERANSDFRNLRTKEQITKYRAFSLATLNYWLKNREENGLAGAVISKSTRRVYIDFMKLNSWIATHDGTAGLIELMCSL